MVLFIFIFIVHLPVSYLCGKYYIYIYIYLNKLQNVTWVLTQGTNNCIQNYKYNNNNNIFKHSGYKLVGKKRTI